VAARSKASVCGCSLAGIVGSNPAGSMAVSSVVCCQRSVHRTDHSSRGVLPSVVCLIECSRKACTERKPWPTVAVTSRGVNHAGDSNPQ